MRRHNLREPADAWLPPPAELTLSGDELHVWRAGLDRSPSDLRRLEQLLSGEERVRAGRFYLARDQERFIAARGLLRVILGRYLGRGPGRLRFCYSPHGKPSLAREAGDPDLRFNLSHSHGLVLYAVTYGREVGVDLEQIRPAPAEERIAERFFTECEVAALRAMPAAVQLQAFFRYWTLKEAYLKARGEGLAISLRDFTVSLTPGEPAALLSVPGEPAELTRWSLHELDPGPGYVGAVAAEGRDWRLRCWHGAAERF